MVGLGIFRSIIIREPQKYGGTIVSWTVPSYILMSEQGDTLPGDESLEPHNGNAHPLYGRTMGSDLMMRMRAGFLIICSQTYLVGVNGSRIMQGKCWE